MTPLQEDELADLQADVARAERERDEAEAETARVRKEGEFRWRDLAVEKPRDAQHVVATDGTRQWLDWWHDADGKLHWPHENRTGTHWCPIPPIEDIELKF